MCELFGVSSDRKVRINDYLNTFYKRSVEPESSVSAPIAIAQACTDGTKHYSTFSSSSAIKVPEGVTVSEIGVEDGELLVDDYANGAVVPANTGVMVSSTVPGIHVAMLSSEVGTSKLGADNNLRPSGAAGITADEFGLVFTAVREFYGEGIG